MKFPQQANKKANSFLLDEIDQDQDKDQDLSSNPSLKTRPTANFDIEKQLDDEDSVCTHKPEQRTHKTDFKDHLCTDLEQSLNQARGTTRGTDSNLLELMLAEEKHTNIIKKGNLEQIK